jgi:cyclophilin family peptidyl-prolyl cis-trans isomerase
LHFALRYIINQNIKFMNNRLKTIQILLLLLLIHSCNGPGGNENTSIIIKTTLGDIKIKLYDGTPIHRDNFIKLVNSGVYENVSFHRVIKDFMIQTGDPLTRPDLSESSTDSLNTFTISAEFTPLYYHKKGALAAARKGNEENPEMRSSGTQFYIVQGVKFNDTELDQAEQRINSNIKQAVFNKILKHTADSLIRFGKTTSEAEIQEIASVKMFEYLSGYNNYKISEDQRNVYKTLGGVPRLDGTYTVFGEVTEGLDIVDKIAAVPTDSNDKPLNDIRILKIKIIRNQSNP